jgi:hypothetical protein
MANFLGCLLMATVTLPASFYIARGFLRGLLRIMDSRRHVL